jgi:hypothetical protein
MAEVARRVETDPVAKRDKDDPIHLVSYQPTFSTSGNFHFFSNSDFSGP